MSFYGREAVSVENDQLRVTVLKQGGHLAEIFHKKQAISPLWIPPWPSGEPSTYDAQAHPQYGSDAESKLLMGIMGHNLCLDLFGPPSAEEAAAGLTVHGEASVLPYDVRHSSDSIELSATLPLSQLHFRRTLQLEGETVLFEESVTNLTALDRPLTWTQHVTLGPPFIHSGTCFAFPAMRSRTMESSTFDGGVMAAATDFVWPHLPLAAGGTVDLRHFSDQEAFSRFSTHLMADEARAGFAAYSPEHQTLITYQWSRNDFPWLGFWQENRKRSLPPWNNKTVTCGLEFGTAPFPETRRERFSRPPLFETPVYRWLPAHATIQVAYQACLRQAREFAADAWL